MSEVSVQGDGFDQRLEAARQRAGLDAPTGRPAASSGDAHPLSIALRLGAEMIGALLVACLIGWGLDRLLGTRPWIMIAFLPIGVAAGIMNLLRAASPGTARGDKGNAARRGKGWGT